MENEKDYRYNDKSERYRSMNRLYIIATSILCVLFLLYLLMKIGTKSISNATAIGNLVLMSVFTIVNLATYFRDKASIKFKQYVVIEIAIEFVLLGMQTNAEFLYYILLGVLALQIPYYDHKAFKKYSITYACLFTLIVIIRIAKGLINADVDALCRVTCVYLLLYVIYKIGGITKLFSDHALGSVEAQSQKQKEVFEGVLSISHTVQEEASKSSSLVDDLVHITQNVADSMSDIASATNTTAQNIQEQNNMTQSIQTAIEETSEHSKQMVNIATESNESIQENLKVMESLKNQSMQIANTNSEVTQSMAKLQDKTNEVQNIAGMILSISNKTNLLALNASIESARAGEAGKGFAVVAEQIRQLAEQTKQSTEEITRITDELNENANAVVKSVESSVEATNDQHEKILSAAASFEKLDSNITQLIRGIGAIDSQITGLSDSNNRIVDNITQLSATTQEVTASADQVQNMSRQNLSHAQEVKDAINLISDTSDKLKKFF